jgi:hypothetical protein
MTLPRITFVIITVCLMVGSVAALMTSGVAGALVASSTPSTATAPEQTPSITQALPGQGSIVGGILLGSSTSTVLPSLATTTAAATTTIGLGVPSEHNNLGVTGSCVVTQSSNAKQCAIYVTYTTPTGDPVLGIPVTIRTMNAEGSFVDVDGPLLIQEGPGKVVEYSGILPNTSAADVATYVGPASATSTLFVVTTPDGLRAQSTFASSTAVR